MFLYLGVSGHPYVCTPPVHLYTPCTFLGSDSPICPILLCICMLSEASECCREVVGPLTCWTPPPVWGASPYVLHPHSVVCFLVHLYVSGISAYDMGNISLMLGVWVCSPIYWGYQHMGCPYASSCMFL